MSNPIIFTITNAGLNAALDAENNGLKLSLNKVKVGTGKYVPSAATTAMTGVWGTFDIAAGSVETASKTLRLSTVVSSATKKDVFEVGIFTNTNILFAVASITGSDPFLSVWPNIDFVASFGLVLGAIDAATITVSFDPNSPLALSIFNQHVTTADPHNQYTKKTVFDAHKAQNTLEHNNLSDLISAEAIARSNADTAHLNATDPHNQYPIKNALANIIYPVGSWHGTNNLSYNPATALSALFGYQTTWYLWPYVPIGVANTSAPLGQMTELASGSGQLASTTRIWQRLEDGASSPTYTLTANKTTVNEGQQVTFTLNTTQVAQGTSVAWKITGIQSADITPNELTGNFVIGAGGSASKTITLVEDEATEGTETLKFSLTYIPTTFVNVTIADTSFLVERYAEYNSLSSSNNILVKPNEVIEVVLLGGSGSGGGLYQQNDGSVPRIIAEPGFATVLFKQSSPIATAEGGFGGISGRWNDTGAAFNGSGGAGGSTSVASGIVTTLTQVNGSNGKQTQADHTGGAAAVIAGRSGGEGMGYITGTSPEIYGFGGGGGGGGYVKIKYKNNSSGNETLVLVVGRGGIGAILGANSAGDGSNGFASVHWNKP